MFNVKSFFAMKTLGTYTRVLIIAIIGFFCMPSLSAETDNTPQEYPFNATGEMIRRTDSMTLLYKMELHGHKPANNIIGHMKVFDNRDTLKPLASFEIKSLSDRGEDEKQIAFMIQGPEGKAASFFRKCRLVYDKWNNRFELYPEYRSHLTDLDKYIEIPASQFRLAATIRPTDTASLEAINQKVATQSTQTKTETSDDITNDSTLTVNTANKYLGDGTWKGNLRARNNLYKSSGFNIFRWMIVAIFTIFLVFMLPKAYKAKQTPPLILALFCFLMVNFYGFYPFWVVMPAFMIAYPRLYSKVYPLSFVKTFRIFTIILIVTFFLFSMTFYQIWGWSSIREMFGWAVAGALSWYFLSLHIGKSCCRVCGAYGNHKKLSEKLVRREVRRSRIHDDKFDHTEVRSDEIIDWYKRRYGVQIDIVETFDVYYECLNCHNIFKNKEEKFKSQEKW